jgi:kinesin family member 5
MAEPSVLHYDKQKSGLVQRVVDELLVCFGSSASTQTVKLSMVKTYLRKKMRAFLDLSKDNLKIKHGEIQGNYIYGATEISILNSSDALENFFPGIDNIAVGKTQTHLASSRNLCLYIFLVQYRSTSDESVPSGKIILIDLDGSMTIKKIGAEGRVLQMRRQSTVSLTH